MLNIYNYMPYLDFEEMTYIQNLTKDFTEEQLRQFASIYGPRRKDPQMILITALIGFLGISGIHRFILGQIGMGILYFFTAGLCFIGTIVDLVNYKKFTFEANMKAIHETLTIIKHSV
ncbi:MAG: NINE protein [Ignavibacteriales bacterium]|nr:NINE protein [Ignavibacteriales bacterium]